MHEAFLLPAREGIIPRIEVRHQDARILCKHLVDNRRFAGRGHFEEDMGPIGKDPDILLGAFDGEKGLIDVDKRTLEQSLPHETFRRRIVLRKAFDKFDERSNTGPLTKQVLHRLDNDAVGETEYDTLINDPGLQGTSK